MATKRTNTRKDFTQVALSVVQKAAGEAPGAAPKLKAKPASKLPHQGADKKGR
jgi:hypothetical protein